MTYLPLRPPTDTASSLTGLAYLFDRPPKRSQPINIYTQQQREGGGPEAIVLHVVYVAECGREMQAAHLSLVTAFLTSSLPQPKALLPI